MAAGREPALRAVLAPMNAGRAWPTRDNAWCPSARSSAALRALRAARRPDAWRPRSLRPAAPARCRTYLAFLGDCDGPARECSRRVRARARRPGLREIFAHCVGFDAGRDLLAWMLGARSAGGGELRELGRPHRACRSARRARCSARWRAQVDRAGGRVRGRRRSSAGASWSTSSQAELPAGRLSLTPHAPTPLALAAAQLRARRSRFRWSALLALPFLIVAVAVAASCCCAARETHDPEICPRPTRRRRSAAAAARRPRRHQPVHGARLGEAGRCSGAGC